MKRFKNFMMFMLTFVFSLSLAACGPHDNGGGPIAEGGGNAGGGSTDETPVPPDGEDLSVLVAYFSCTNSTKRAAENIQSLIDSDIYRIVPAEPYTSADLNYSDSSCRANREQNDANARPAVNGGAENFRAYDVVYIGYPIWWGQAPKIIYTFLESYDFSGKTIIPFCTSGGSGMGTSATNLHACAASATWKSGGLVRASAMQSDIRALIDMM